VQVELSLVEEPPPPPPAPQPDPPLEPPPPQFLVPALLPPPPPPRPRHVVPPRHTPPHPPREQIVVPPQTAQPQVETSGRVAQQAPENHSAVGAYIGRLHALVARNTVPPRNAVYRLQHPSGEVIVGFTLARNGALSDVHLIRSSGAAVLDAQALAIVSSLRYPAMPEDVYPGASAHAFSVPVAFDYEGGDDGL
jgi:protein TonB